MSNRSKMGDFAVDGLLAGLMAGIVMGAYLMIAGIVVGEAPLAVLGLFSPSGNGDPLLGGVAHLAVSAIYGALLGILFQVPGIRARGAAAGIAYGVILFLMAQYLIIPETGSSLQAFAPFNLAAAHILYGLVLGWRLKSQGNASVEA